MKMSTFLFAGVALCATALPVHASPATDALFTEFTAAGGKNFSAEAGKKAWALEVEGKGGKVFSCTSCHGNDLTQAGKHAKTQKPIKPMAASANPDRYTDAKKVQKWFKRNCKWTWGRECSAQEKGDILTYLLTQ